MLEANLLFIYNNDIPEDMGSKLVIYADDTSNYSCHNSKYFRFVKVGNENELQSFFLIGTEK